MDMQFPHFRGRCVGQSLKLAKGEYPSGQPLKLSGDVRNHFIALDTSLAGPIAEPVSKLCKSTDSVISSKQNKVTQPSLVVNEQRRKECCGGGCPPKNHIDISTPTVGICSSPSSIKSKPPNSYIMGNLEKPLRG